MSDGDLELMHDTGYLLARSSGLVVRMTNARLAHRGLRVRHFSVLSVVCDAEGTSQRELSEFLGLDPSQIVALVDLLQEEGLVERRPHRTDRRAYEVVPTPAGRVAREETRADVVAGREEFLAPLDADERSLLLGMLQRLAYPPKDSAGSAQQEVE